MTYSCSDFVDSVLDALSIEVPDESRDSPSEQADLALTEIERLKAVERLQEFAVKPVVSFIAHTCTMPGSWAKGKTIDEAVKNLQSECGARFFKSTGYKIFLCHPETTVGEMGAFRYPIKGGYDPIEVMNKSKVR